MQYSSAVVHVSIMLPITVVSIGLGKYQARARTSLILVMSWGLSVIIFSGLAIF